LARSAVLDLATWLHAADCTLPSSWETKVVDTLINKHIRLDVEGAPQTARLVDSAVPVWPLIGLYKVTHDIGVVAADCDVPVEVVQAAVMFYEQPDVRPVIDAKLAFAAS